MGERVLSPAFFAPHLIDRLVNLDRPKIFASSVALYLKVRLLA